MDSKELTDYKKDLRREAYRVRESAWRADPDAGVALKRHLMESVPIAPGIAVSGYWPLEGEIDVRPVLAALDALGHPVGLPVVVAKGEPLRFRRWHPSDVMVMGSFKVLTPPEGAPDVIPQVLLVPLLAFDPDGYRLGYGGGFYDRTLAKLRAAGHALAVGVAYAAQELAAVPRGPHDEPLDYVVTERAVFRFSDRKT
ncbi:MAG: 5-formyltetrahydrofolate cyclo-ligase [Rhodospirillaceae bacterium]|nr:5-formyltetrahydrofolate cyclo-ligase [Rhodospirillaceae bacterium]